ncbi:MAG: TIGR02678 family protein, partial [Solirubrobacteraceae bacterium]
MTLRDLDDREERARALKALLGALFVGADAPEYALIRRHERELATTLQVTYGYQLEVASTAARASGLPTADGLRRPLRIRPASVSGRKRPPDEWPVLGDRACVLLLLTLVALERSGVQTAIAELAQEVERAGADAEPPISVDFRQRSERVAFADSLDLLCAWGVTEHTSGSHESYTRREQGDDEALFTVDRRRLALLLRDPAMALEATTLGGLVDESGRYSPTPEGENRARAERLARRLTEDPVLLLADLDDDDRAYFLSQRARVEGAVAAATGYEVERRAEGSALIVDDRAFTDLPFPTNATVKQVALLLCDALADAGPGGELSFEALRDAVAELVSKHGRHWDRNAEDPDEIAGLTGAASEILLASDLARRCGARGLTAT